MFNINGENVKAFENLMSTVNVVSLDTWLGMNLAGNFYTFQQECFLLLQKYKNSENINKSWPGKYIVRFIIEKMVTSKHLFRLLEF